MWRETEDQEPMPVYPGGTDAYGNDVMGAHYRHWVGDGNHGLFVTLTDVWVLKPQIIQKLPTLAWVPVDHEPAPRMVTQWFNETQAIPLAMSRFGEDMLASAGFETLYAPHAVDTSIFNPEGREGAKERLGVPEEQFVVGMVAANTGRPGRKGWMEALQAYALFERDKTDVALYLHSPLVSPTGEPLMDMIGSLQLKPYCVNQYHLQLGQASEVVADTVRAFDVLLNPSHGEGFGIAPLEAQAVGTPVIATNFSAMKEVVGKGCGWLVGGQRIWTKFDSWQVSPSIPRLVRSLNEAYEEWRGGVSRLEACVAHAQQYDADRVLEEHWAPAAQEAIDILRWRKTQPRAIRV